jgi:hypothetical protein
VPDITLAAPLTVPTLVTARSKLPDDLVLAEFSDLVASFTTLMHMAARLGGPQVYRLTGERRSSPPVQIERAQYGSDFMVIVSIATAVGGASAAVGGSVLLYAKALKSIAEARLVNEERLAKRDRRLERRKKRQRAAEEVRAQVPQRIDVILSRDARHAVDAQLGGQVDDEVYIALGLLAEYGVQLEITE